MKRFLQILFLLVFVLDVHSVQAQFEKANQEFEQLSYATALDLYKKDFESNKRLVSLQRIAECSKKMKLYKEWESWSSKLVQFDGKNPESFLMYGQALLSNGKYMEAKQAFHLYGRYANGKLGEAQFLMASCDSAITQLSNPVSLATVKPHDVLNTPYDDWGLVKYREGFVFSSDRPWEQKNIDKNDHKVYGWTGRPFLKLFYVEYNKENNSFGNPTLFSDFFNGEYHTAGAAFNDRENTVFFSRTRFITTPETGNKPILRNEIFMSEAWKEAAPFKYNSILKYSVGDPACSADGKRLYFVSDMPGGYGGSDIYYCELGPDKEWGPFKNMGPEINTSGDERFPTLMGDNVLFFSSNGRIGMGGLDIYRATFEKNKWGNIIHMDYPINSPQDDFGLIVTKISSVPEYPDKVKLEGFFASDRFDGKGSDDIYTYTCITPQFQKEYILKGRTMNKETGLPISGVTISIMDIKTNSVTTFKSDDKGDYVLPLKPNREYEIVMKRNNYFASKQRLNTGDKLSVDALQADLKFDPIVLDRTKRLNNIYYDVNKATITPESQVELDNLLSVMKENPEISIELSAHTDSRGDATANLALSQKRAQTIADYIIAHGVAANRIIAKGYGKTKPLVSCDNGDCSEAEHALNRRTEFKVLRVNTSMQANNK
ncbi:OmpA family protein [Solitalea koreensis]|uniref:WD40-like Beta Propeller Repeat n=1 Tax=Solitalea koreensis TaxID=543615 RepID=A0A521E123_9SPHI|nr:OmpA family protein [Solitalea koreensis]SMO77592.1 WD40-like Beta Propeller Repeat [Solitalea koreensis]